MGYPLLLLNQKSLNGAWLKYIYSQKKWQTDDKRGHLLQLQNKQTSEFPTTITKMTCKIIFHRMIIGLQVGSNNVINGFAIFIDSLKFHPHSNHIS